MGIFSSLIRGNKISNIIDKYDIFLPPHNELGSKLSFVQANENLHWFSEQLPARFEKISHILDEFGICTSINNPEDARLTASLLDQFFKNELVFYKKFENILAPGWQERERENPSSAIGFMTDIAIFCGNCITSLQPLLSWSVDTDEFSIKNKSMTLGNIVLFTPAKLAPSETALSLDIRSWVIDAMWDISKNRKSTVFYRKNYFDFISLAVDGRYHQKF